MSSFVRGGIKSIDGQREGRWVMRKYTVLGVLALLVLLVPVAALLLSCGGGGSSGSSDASGTNAGTVSINVTDAKPKLPVQDVEHVYVTFDEVQVHKAGGGWISLPVVAPAPHTIDLLQFSDGTTTQLVPPVKLESGKYTQVRIIVSDAWLVIGGVNYPLIVPSGKLRTDKDFDFDVHGGGAVDLTVDFDLSQSIVVQGNGGYKLKPVLHLVGTEEAATIRGTIPAAAFGSSADPATVTVFWDQDANCTLDSTDEVYTEIVVPKTDPNFGIFWLVPNEAYIVQIVVGGNTFLFTVPGSSGGVCGTLPPSAVYDLGVATIQGSIAPGTFGASTQATVTVLLDPDGDGLGDLSGDDEAYTEVTVDKPATGDAGFSISVFPSQPYVVQVEVDSTLKYQEAIPANDLPAGATFPLNEGNPI
jgi:hypothetical protein